jgi:hypothetical protein
VEHFVEEILFEVFLLLRFFLTLEVSYFRFNFLSDTTLSIRKMISSFLDFFIGNSLQDVQKF